LVAGTFLKEDNHLSIGQAPGANGPDWTDIVKFAKKSCAVRANYKEGAVPK